MNKLVKSILLVAILLLTYCFGCVSFAYGTGTANAANYTVTYKWADGNGTYQTKSTASVSYGYALNFPAMESYDWFKFDGWYTDSARTTVAPTVFTENKNLTLYGAYVFDVGDGDVNADGLVNTDDITLFRKHVVGGYKMTVVESGKEWETASNGISESTTYFLKRAADVNGDGKANLRDVSEIRMAIVSGYGLGVWKNTDVAGQTISAYTTVYFYNADSWATPHVYSWNGTVSPKAWPGIKMSAVSGQSGWYEAQIPADMSNVIFNDNKVNQTIDLSFNSQKPYYCCGSWNDKFVSTMTVYFYNNVNYDKIYAHHYLDGGVNSTNWPGDEMTPVVGHANWYSVVIPANKQKIIFNQYSDQLPTMDIDHSKPYYYNGEWKETMFSTIYYFNKDGWANPCAHYWITNGAETGWPGVKMAPVSGQPGLFSVDIPWEMQNIIFSDNGSYQSSNLTINRNQPYYNDGWKNYYKVCLQVDGVNYDMAYDTVKNEYILKGINLKVNQTVKVIYFGNECVNYQEDCGFSGTVAKDGAHDFFYKPYDNNIWVTHP